MDVAENWNHFRGLSDSIADLKALHQHARGQAEYFSDRNEETEAEYAKEEIVWRFRHLVLDYMLKLVFVGVSGDSELLPRWENLSAEQKPDSFNNTLDRHKHAIRLVLKRSDPGAFGDKTSLYRAASELEGNGPDAVRNYIGKHVDDEPEDEQAWRERLDVQS